MKVLFDTNVILDLLLDRKPFAQDAAKCISKVEAGKIEGYLCATTVTTLFYLIEKAAGPGKARKSIGILLALFEIAPVNRIILEQALKPASKEYEDAVLHEAARLIQADIIVTRNTADFKHATIPILLPGQL